MITEKGLEHHVELVRKTLTEAREAHIQMLAAKEELSILSEKMENLAKEYRLSINEVCDRHMKELVEKDELIAQLQEELEHYRSAEAQGDAEEKALMGVVTQSTEKEEPISVTPEKVPEFKVGDKVSMRYWNGDNREVWKHGYEIIGDGDWTIDNPLYSIRKIGDEHPGGLIDESDLSHVSSPPPEAQSTDKVAKFHKGDKVDALYNDQWTTGYEIYMVDKTRFPNVRYGLSHAYIANTYSDGSNLRLTEPPFEQI